MDYEEMIAWLNRYRKAKQAEPRLRERLQNENRRAEYTDILRSASPGGTADDLDQAVTEINTRRKTLAMQLLYGEVAKGQIDEAINALEREVLQQRYIDGRTNRQIADRMRITERYVRKLHRIGVTKIMKKIEKNKN